MTVHVHSNVLQTPIWWACAGCGHWLCEWCLRTHACWMPEDVA